MRKFLLTLLLGLVACSGGARESSWKLYKDSAVSSEIFLVLDMKYFGTDIQQEECERLRTFYSQINRDRTFYCMLNDSFPPDTPLKTTSRP
jgi:hypothetical protein